MTDAEDDDLVRRGSAGGGTSVGVEERGEFVLDRTGDWAVMEPNLRGVGECEWAECGPGEVIPGKADALGDRVLQ